MECSCPLSNISAVVHCSGVPWILRSLRRRRWSPQILNIRLVLEFAPVLIWRFGIELNRDFAVLACTRCSHLAFRHYSIKSVRNFLCPWLWRSTPRPAYNSMPTEVGDGRAGHASPSWQEESHFAMMTTLRRLCDSTAARLPATDIRHTEVAQLSRRS